MVVRVRDASWVKSQTFMSLVSSLVLTSNIYSITFIMVERS